MPWTQNHVIYCHQLFSLAFCLPLKPEQTSRKHKMKLNTLLWWNTLVNIRLPRSERLIVMLSWSRQEVSKGDTFSVEIRCWKTCWFKSLKGFELQHLVKSKTTLNQILNNLRQKSKRISINFSDSMAKTFSQRNTCMNVVFTFQVIIVHCIQN